MKNRLRAMRTERNWSQASLAERLSVSRQTVNALETGKYDPSLALALKIAQLFDCPIETIFFPEQESMFAKRFSEDDNFEGLTQKAGEVIELAQDESRRLRHNFVGTEQILLGLIGERTSLAAKILQSMGVNLWTARTEVQKIIGYGITLIDRPRPFTPRARRVLELAKEAASQLGHQDVDTEHLLLGLIREGQGAAAWALRNLGIDLQNLEQQILEQLQQVGLERDSTPQLTKPSRFTWTTGSALSPNDRPADFSSGEITARLGALLLSWVEPRQLGHVISLAGFQLTNGDVLVPRLAFVSRSRLKRVPRTYPELVPDLVVEIKSAFDRLAPLKERIQLCLELDTVVGLLIDPDEQTVAVHRQGSEVVVLGNGDMLALPELLPGWEIPVSELWPPVFD